MTGGRHLTANEFANVPEALRSQYTDDMFEQTDALQKFLENPELVVDGELIFHCYCVLLLLLSLLWLLLLVVVVVLL